MVLITSLITACFEKHIFQHKNLFNFSLAMSAKVLVAIAVFFTYCLQMYAPMDILWTRIKGRVGKPYQNLGQVALRTISVVFTGEFLLFRSISILLALSPPRVVFLNAEGQAGPLSSWIKFCWTLLR